MTKFFGKIFLINFAVGVVTGIVQEFQFGMNWSAYSQFVGNVFGAPLAMEALLAFFMESTFIGLWIFGWNKLSPRLHLATIWLAAIGTSLSAYFILAANSWMQHPVGYQVLPGTHRVILTSIWALLTNSTALAAWPHVFFASFMVAGVVLIAVSAWHVARNSQLEVFRPVMRVGLAVTLAAGIATAVTGDIQARLMDSQQPMKMAAAEALYNTSDSRVLLAVHHRLAERQQGTVEHPRARPAVADRHPEPARHRAGHQQRRGAPTPRSTGRGSYKPIIPVTYWSFRLMVGFGMLAALLAAIGLWLTRRRRIPRSRWFYRAALWGLALPYLASTMGWIFTEMGRQPWTVFGLLTTAQSVSPGVTASSVIISLTVFTLLYAGLAAIAGWLTVRHVKEGAPEESEQPGASEPLPVFQY